MSNTALVILHEGFEEMEAIAPIDILRRGEVSVTVASLAKEIAVVGKNKVTVTADVDLDQALTHDYDVIVLPGGPGVNKGLRQDHRVKQALRRQLDTGRTVAAICAAPLTLLDADLLEGRRYTSHFTTAEELPARDATQPVVIDGQLITSQGAGTATAFALAILSELCGRELADEIASSIAFRSPQ